MDHLRDEQLVRRYLKEKDEKALEELVGRYVPSVYGFARMYTGDADKAADIAQETFVKAWKHLKRFDQKKHFKAWLFTIAKRTAIDWLRHRDAVPFSMLENDPAASLADDSRPIVEQLSLKETSRELAAAMARLSGPHAAAVELHLNGGMNFREMAADLREPLNTVKSRYRRGIAMLKKILRD